MAQATMQDHVARLKAALPSYLRTAEPGELRIVWQKQFDYVTSRPELLTMPPGLTTLSVMEKMTYLEQMLAIFNHEMYVEGLQKTYPHLHPELLQFNKSHLAASLVEAREIGTQDALRAVLKEEHSGIYRMHLFSPEFSQKLVKELEHLENWCQEHEINLQHPSSTSTAGVVLSHIGFKPLFDHIVAEWLNPIAAILFPHFGGGTMRKHHSFSVAFAPEGAGKLRKFEFHTDDSELTFNTCLEGSHFEGGDLYFKGLRCSSHQQDPPRLSEDITVQQVPGTALVYAGKHRHGSHPVTSGVCHSLLLWCQSNRFRREMRAREELARDTQPGLCQWWCGSKLNLARVSQDNTVKSKFLRVFGVKPAVPPQDEAMRIYLEHVQRAQDRSRADEQKSLEQHKGKTNPSHAEIPLTPPSIPRLAHHRKTSLTMSYSSLPVGGSKPMPRPLQFAPDLVDPLETFIGKLRLKDPETVLRAFDKNGVGMDVLPTLSDFDLADIGIGLGDRRRILMAVPRPQEDLLRTLIQPRDDDGNMPAVKIKMMQFDGGGSSPSLMSPR